MNTHQAQRARSQFTVLVTYELSSPHLTSLLTPWGQHKAWNKATAKHSSTWGKAGSRPSLGKGQPLSPNAVPKSHYTGLDTSSTDGEAGDLPYIPSRGRRTVNPGE